jgi:hypothetical protein|nr:MAG TPA: hypothetical protein [Bacteriophage sp.]
MSDMVGSIETKSDGNAIIHLEEENLEVSTDEMVGISMATVFMLMIKRNKESDAEKKKELEENILFQLKVLDSLSNAYRSIK